MAKNDREAAPGPRVVWQITSDGIKPTQTPHWFIGRNPVERSIPPKMSIDIRLCVAAGCNLIALPAEAHIEVPTVIPAGTEVVVRVRNSSEHSQLTVGDRDALVRLVPLLLPEGLRSEEG